MRIRRAVLGGRPKTIEYSCGDNALVRPFLEKAGNGRAMSTSTQGQPRAQPALSAQAPRVLLTVADAQASGRCQCIQPVTLIGSRRDCHLPLNHPEISKVHCAVVNTGRVVLVCDLCSRGGTFINDKAVRITLLKPGDRLRLGPVTVQVEFETSIAAGDTQHSAIPLLLAGRERRFEITSQAAVVGRRGTCDVALDTPDVSLAHALIFLLDHAPAVYDLGSRSGTFLNGERVALAWLRPQDKLNIGGEELTVQWTGPCGGTSPGPASGGSVPLEKPRLSSNAAAAPVPETVCAAASPAVETALPEASIPATAADLLERTRALPPGAAPVLGGELQDLEQSIAVLHGHIASSRARLDERAARLDQREAEIRRLTEQAEEERAKTEARRAELAAQAAEIAQARQALDLQRRAVEDALRAYEKEKQETRRAQAETEAAQTRLQEAQTQFETARQRLEADQSQLETTRRQLEAERLQFEAERTQLKARSAELEARAKEWSQQEAALKQREAVLAQGEAALAQRAAQENEAARKIEQFKAAIQEATQLFGPTDHAAKTTSPPPVAARKAPASPAGVADKTVAPPDKLPAPLVSQPIFAVPPLRSPKE